MNQAQSRFTGLFETCMVSYKLIIFLLSSSKGMVISVITSLENIGIISMLYASNVLLIPAHSMQTIFSITLNSIVKRIFKH